MTSRFCFNLLETNFFFCFTHSLKSLSTSLTVWNSVVQQAESRWLLANGGELQPSSLPDAYPPLPRPHLLQTVYSIDFSSREKHTPAFCPWVAHQPRPTLLLDSHTFHSLVFVFMRENKCKTNRSCAQFVMSLLCIFRIFFSKLQFKKKKKAIFYKTYLNFFPVKGSRPHPKHCTLAPAVSPECTRLF